MLEKAPEERDFKKRICIFTKKFKQRQFLLPACVNQPPYFSVRKTSTPNGLFQTINGLKILMGYTK